MWLMATILDSAAIETSSELSQSKLNISQQHVLEGNYLYEKNIF